MAAKKRSRAKPAPVYTVNSVSPLHFQLAYVAWLAAGWMYDSKEILDGHSWVDAGGIRHLWLKLSGGEVAIFIENPCLPGLPLEVMETPHA